MASTAALLAGCGDDGAPAPGRVPEPSVSPAPREDPAGTIVPTGGAPEGVAADPVSGLAAVAVRDPDRLEIVDLARERVVRRVPLPGGARHLQATGTGSVLVPVERADRLLEVPLDGGEPTSVAAGRFPHDAAAWRDRRIVANEFGDSVSVIDGRGDASPVPTSAQPGGVAVTDNGLAAVVAVRAHRLDAIDVRTAEPIGSVAAGAGPTHVVAGGGERVHVVDTLGGAVLAFELDGRPRLVARARVPGRPYGIAIDRVRGRVWVTVTAANRLVELRLEGRRLVPGRSFPTLRQPNSVAVEQESGRVVVAGRAADAVQIVNPFGRRSR